jgi:hypothetical protein
MMSLLLKKLVTLSGQAIFGKEIDELQREVVQKRFMQAAITSAAVIMPLIAVTAPKQPKPWQLMELGLGAVMGVLGSETAKRRAEIERRYQSTVLLNRQVHQKETENRFTKHQAISDVIRDRSFLEALDVQAIPPLAQAEYAQRMSIPMGFLQAPVEDVPEAGGGTGTYQVDLSVQQLQQAVKRLEQVFSVDISWLDSQFVSDSKIVVGIKGSGKSVYIRYEASRFLIENPTASLVIIDPHYDPDSTEGRWLNNIDPYALKNTVVFRDKQMVLQQLVNFKTELMRRIDQNLKPPAVPRMKMIIDEGENLKRNMRPDDFKNFYLDTIDMVQDEGRKFGADITVVVHSLKKENTGIDSAALAQMEWLLFEKSAYDPTTKYPADFDQQDIKTKAKAIAATLVPTPGKRPRGKTVVVIKTSGVEPFIGVLPLLHAPVIELKDGSYTQQAPGEIKTLEDLVTDDFEKEDTETGVKDTPTWTIDPLDTTTPASGKPDVKEVFIRFKIWIAECREKLGEIPTPDEIRQAWHLETGQTLSDPALTYLIERLQS